MEMKLILSFVVRFSSFFSVSDKLVGYFSQIQGCSGHIMLSLNHRKVRKSTSEAAMSNSVTVMFFQKGLSEV